MKQLSIAVALILFALCLSAQAQSSSKVETIAQLESALSEAYQVETLGKLDAGRSFKRKVRVVIEHSLGTGAEQYESKLVRTFEQLERWLRSRQREDGTPFRESRPLLRCRNGTCTYDFNGGILHNHLYLKRFTYGYHNGQPYIRTIYLLDGD